MDTMNYGQFAADLGTFYQKVAEAMEQYIEANEGNGEDTDWDELSDKESSLLRYSETFTELAASIAFADAQACFQEVQQATNSINQEVAKIDNANKWISFGGALIGLGEAIVTKNGSGVSSAVQTILNTFKKPDPATPAADEQLT